MFPNSVVSCYVSQSAFDSMFLKSSDTFDPILQLKPLAKTIKVPCRGELAVKLRDQMCSAVQFSILWKHTQLFPHLKSYSAVT